MHFADVQAQLNDLPTTFRRQGTPYTQLIDLLTSGLNTFTVGVDSTMNQIVTFENAQDGWLDVWGLLFLVPRNPNEGDIPYRRRITETVLAWVATFPGIQAWLALFAAGGTVVENLPQLGYKLTLPATMSITEIAMFLNNFSRIRPAGVPFSVQQAAGGLYLGTIAFMGLGRTQGSYLSAPTSSQALAIAATTNNAQPMIPDVYLTDPSINGLV